MTFTSPPQLEPEKPSKQPDRTPFEFREFIRTPWNKLAGRLAGAKRGLKREDRVFAARDRRKRDSSLPFAPNRPDARTN